MVSKNDIYWMDRHIIDNADDFRFVGYKSDPQDLVERSIELSKQARGHSINEVFEANSNRQDIIIEKRDALANLLKENYDKDHAIDGGIISSYISSVVDEMAVSDYINDQLDMMSRKQYLKYLEAHDPDLIYTTYTNKDIGTRNEAIVNITSGDQFDSYVEGFYPSGDDYEVHSPNSMYSIDIFNSTDARDESRKLISYRGFRLGEIVETPDTENPFKDGSREFVSSEDSEHPGKYIIKDDEVYRYSYDETEVQKISGKDSVMEINDKNQRHETIQYFRENIFESTVKFLNRETNRMDEFDLSAIKPIADDKPLYSIPKMEPVENLKDLESEEELEL